MKQQRTGFSLLIIAILFYTKQLSSNQNFSLKNPKVIIVSFLTSNTKYFLTNSAISTAVLYLLVPIRTQGICET